MSSSIMNRFGQLTGHSAAFPVGAPAGKTKILSSSHGSAAFHGGFLHIAQKDLYVRTTEAFRKSN